MKTAVIDFKGALQSKAAEPVISTLTQVLASSYALSALAQNSHWNVVAPTFSQLHSLFGTIYDDASEMVDDIAERIRQLGGFVQVDLAEFQSRAGFSQPAAPQDWHVWVNALLAAHEKVIADWKAVETAAEAAGDLHVQDLGIQYVQDLMKTTWMLRSTVA